MRRRIFISSPRDIHLDEDHKNLKRAIIDEIRNLGYEPQIFNPEDGSLGLAKGTGWSLDNAEKIIRRCVGAVLIGFPYWKECVEIDKPDKKVSLVTEYCHYEGAIARMLRLPILVILEKNVRERVIFLSHGGEAVIESPDNADKEWARSPAFKNFLAGWNDDKVKKRRDVFLGYCSKSIETAIMINRFLTEDHNVKVMDWHEDFKPTNYLMKEIEEAAENCTGAIFLFTKDDELDTKQKLIKTIAPRDNVVFEAGYFISVKGNDRILIIVEDGCKILTDLSGKIFTPLKNRKNISSVKENLKRFIEDCL